MNDIICFYIIFNWLIKKVFSINNKVIVFYFCSWKMISWRSFSISIVLNAKTKSLFTPWKLGSGICGQFGLCSFVYSFVTVSKLKIFNIIILIHLFSYFSCTRSLIIPYAYVSIESIDSSLLSSFELKAILLIFSVKTCPSLLNHCCVFNIGLLFLINYSLFFKNYLC